MISCSALKVEVVSASPCLLCSPVLSFVVLSCAVSCRAASCRGRVRARARACARARARVRARAFACLVHHCDFSFVRSCVLPCLLWSVCLLFEALDLPQWFNDFLFLVYVSNTFPDFKPYLFHI